MRRWLSSIAAVSAALWIRCTGPEPSASGATHLDPPGNAEMPGPSAASGPSDTRTAARDAAPTAARGPGRPSQGDTPLPCDIARVLETSCQGCHAAEPKNVAPMALVTHEDLIAPAVSDPSIAVYQMLARRIHAQDQAMPPSSSRRLTADELAALDGFVAAGAPSGSSDCAEANAVTSAAAPVVAEPSPEDIDRCYRLEVHDQPVAGDTTPYRVESGEFYSCFYFDVPWPAGSQALRVGSLEGPLTHHWMLYDVTEPYEDGQITREVPNCGLELRAILGVHTLHDQPAQQMPAGVGLALPPPGSGHGLLLEVHYFNSGEPTTDASGAEVCTARTPQPHVADLSELGANVFALPPGQRYDLPTSCMPSFNGEIHVFRSFPHMHARGVGLDTRIDHADGSSNVLLDVPFDFNDQRVYETPAVIRAGDNLITTCHYVNDTDHVIWSGFGTGDEMCINFVYAWPAGALVCP